MRMLRVLLEVFYQPLLTEGYFTDSELVNIFPSLEDLIDEHKLFLDNLKKLREENNLIVSEIGSTLLAREAEKEAEERQKVERAAECCRQILNHVNQEVRVMENLLNTDITKRNLVYEGPLTWRVTKDKSVDVHVLLLDEILVLLQKQEERLVLKCHSRTITPTPDGKQMLSPIIKLNSAMTREVATEQEKDGMLEGAEFEDRNPVGGAKMDKAVEAFMADLQTFCRSQPPGQVTLASAAQDRDPEWSSEHLDKESPRFPIVLSLQQSDGVKHHLRLLEDAIQGLKDIETEYWRLQQLMGKFTSSQQPGST
ncbi:hypothetical protein Chor_005257 [Crotalus horridus]